jgi:hypothetical protein
MTGFITAEGLGIPAGGDTYDYVNDQRRLAASVRSTVTVADRTGANAVASAMTADGRPPTVNNPLYVLRQDTMKLEFYDGTTWRDITGALADDTSWTTAALSGSWSAYTGGGAYYAGLKYRMVGNSVQMQGMVLGGSGVITTLPSAYWPQFSNLVLTTAGTSTSPRQVAYIVYANSGVLTYDTGPASPTFVNINHFFPLS